MTLNARRARTEEGSGAVVAGERAEGWCGLGGVCVCVFVLLFELSSSTVRSSQHREGLHLVLLSSSTPYRFLKLGLVSSLFPSLLTSLLSSPLISFHPYSPPLLHPSLMLFVRLQYECGTQHPQSAVSPEYQVQVPTVLQWRP